MTDKPNAPNHALIPFGQHVAKLRKNLGISQEELSGRCGLDRTYISGIERGKRNLSLTNVFKLAKALDVAPKVLLDYPEEDVTPGN